MKHTIAVLFLGILFLMTNSCNSGSNVASGTTTETTNGFVATIYTSDHLPATSCFVSLRQSSYLSDKDLIIPGFSFEGTVDSQGNILCNNLFSGTYSLFLRTPDSSQGIFLDSITLSGDSVVQLDTISLLPTGSLACTIQSSGISEGMLSIRLEGTTLVRSVSSDSTALFSSIPAGRYTVVVSIGDSVIVRQPGITVVSDETTQFAWRTDTKPSFFAEIRVGAREISEDISNYPLSILLDRTRFPDSLLLQNENLLHTIIRQPDGGYSPQETSYFNSDSGRASLWAQVPIVGGIDTTCATMSCIPAMTIPAIKTNVFDESLGWEGVWHFDEMSGDTLKNAVLSGKSGVLSRGNAELPRRIEGILGGALSFSGIQEFARTTIPESDSKQIASLSVSAWVRSEGTGGVLFQLGYDSAFTDTALLTIKLAESGNGMQVIAEGMYSDSGYQISSETTFQNGGWHLVATVIDFQVGTCRIYIDGQSVGTTGEHPMAGIVQSISPVVTIGAGWNGGSSFIGAIDEVRVYRGSESASWLKLDWLTQHAFTTTLIWK